jgi:hypothetical protein
MLQTLKTYSPQEAAVILAGVTKQLLPEELTEPTLEPHPDADVNQRILEEVYHKLKVSPDDKSDESQARVINYIGNELSRAALAYSDVQEITNRIGQQGNLRADAYKVILTSTHEKAARTYGITRAQIKDAVNYPDDFQHLLPGLFGPTDNAISLFVKEHDNESDPFTILVQTKRTGSTLEVNKAFKIYYSDVDLVHSLTPLDVLLAFVNEYGVNITVGDETARFVLHKSIPRGDSQQGIDVFSVPGKFESGTNLSSGFHFKMTESTFEVAVGYMINDTKYLADLEKHKQSRR